MITGFHIVGVQETTNRRGTANKVWQTLAARQKLDVVNALDIEDAGNPLDARENAFQLLAILHVERDFDARAQIPTATFKRADVRAAVADDRGNAGEHPR